jgi:arginyl-tRNA synthetase
VSKDIVREQVINALQQALQEAKNKGQLKIGIMPALSLDLPKRPEWGDLTSTVAMSLAPTEHRSPQEVAQIIVDNLGRQNSMFHRIEIVRPGFLNMTLKHDVWLKVLLEIEERNELYGHTDMGSGQRVLIEYVSANPTGPLHVGHGRGAAVGHATANLLRAVGYEVIEEYYINDAGRQMKLLGMSVLSRYLALLGRASEFPEDGYRGEYVETIASQIRNSLGSELINMPVENAEKKCQDIAYRHLLELIRADLQSFGIKFQSWFSETSLLSSGAVEQALTDLKDKGLLFEEDGAIWFRSSAFGDEKDRVVRKREGEFTYLASDIAYHRDKLFRGYDQLIDVWGADHHGYIPRMQAVIQAYGYDRLRLSVILIQMVSLLREGKKVEMSKRSGEFVTLREVINEVGADAAKFFFLMRRSDTHLDFDLELAKKRSADNPVYYVQYAYARIASLFRTARDREILVPLCSQTDLTVLESPDELGIIRKLSAYPSVIQSSATTREPHRVTFYLQELAGLLHTYYFKHRILPSAAEADMTDDKECFPDLSSVSTKRREPISQKLTAGRLALMRSVQVVLKNGLTVLGISAPERM